MKFLYFFVLYTLLICCNGNRQHSLSYMEIVEEYEKAETKNNELNLSFEKEFNSFFKKPNKNTK